MFGYFNIGGKFNILKGILLPICSHLCTQALAATSKLQYDRRSLLKSIWPPNFDEVFEIHKILSYRFLDLQTSTAAPNYWERDQIMNPGSCRINSGHYQAIATWRWKGKPCIEAMIDQNNQSEHMRKFRNYRITTPHNHHCWTLHKVGLGSPPYLIIIITIVMIIITIIIIVAVNTSTGRTWSLPVHPTSLPPRVVSLYRRLHPVWQVSCFQEMECIASKKLFFVFLLFVKSNI